MRGRPRLYIGNAVPASWPRVDVVRCKAAIARREQQYLFLLSAEHNPLQVRQHPIDRVNAVLVERIGNPARGQHVAVLIGRREVDGTPLDAVRHTGVEAIGNGAAKPQSTAGITAAGRVAGGATVST